MTDSETPHRPMRLEPTLQRFRKLERESRQLRDRATALLARHDLDDGDRARLEIALHGLDAFDNGRHLLVVPLDTETFRRDAATDIAAVCDKVHGRSEPSDISSRNS